MPLRPRLATALTSVLRFFSLAAATFLIAGCAVNTRAIDPISPGNAQQSASSAATKAWAGRISLQVESPSEGVAGQSFSASFELKGEPDRGELTLINPLGNVVGVMRWTPDGALLDSGNGQVQRFDSVEAFLAQATGAAVPISALFDWLRGQNSEVAGWRADLSRFTDGRISARRSQPRPQADLRLVLDR